MATYRERKNGTFEFVVRRKRLLPKPIYLTFATVAQGKAYCDKLEKMLDAGVVPDEFVQHHASGENFRTLINQFIDSATPKKDDVSQLQVLKSKYGARALQELNNDWAHEVVDYLKRERQLVPGTVRKYVGSAARCLDWAVAKGHLLANPLRQLPRGYSSYSEADIRVAGARKEDGFRDVRVPEVDVQPKLIEQALKLKADGEAFALLILLGVNTAMRLREMFTLTNSQIDLNARTLRFSQGQ